MENLFLSNHQRCFIFTYPVEVFESVGEVLFRDFKYVTLLSITPSDYKRFREGWRF